MTVVAVVIPCRNYGRYLRESLESVLAQSHREIEVVVVDYGSTDETPAVAAEYETVRYLSCANEGLGSARNEGLRATHGPLVLFLDADDVLVPDAVETFVDVLEARPDCAFAYGHQRFFDADGPVPQRGSGPQGCLAEDDPYRWMLRASSPLRNASAVVYRRTSIEGLGGFATDLDGCEDLDLNMRLARRHPICCNDRVVLMTRVHDANMTKQWGHMLTNAVAAQKRQRPYAEQHPRYRDDYRAGLAAARSYWGTRLADAAADAARLGAARTAFAGLAVLGRSDPGALPRAALRVVKELSRRRAR
jgi:glycosyltransferase involved in cell wall biosynthesis